MDINNIEKSKELIDNYIRLKEIEEHLLDEGDIVVTEHDKDTEDNYGVDYVSKIRVYIPAPLRAAFLASTKEMLKLEANKIAEL